MPSIVHAKVKKEDNDFDKAGDPVRNLWAAVLRTAFESILSTQRRKNNVTDIVARKRRANMEKAMWFFLSEDSSLRWICHHLDINVDRVRAKALELKYGMEKREEVVQVEEEETCVELPML